MDRFSSGSRLGSVRAKALNAALRAGQQNDNGIAGAALRPSRRELGPGRFLAVNKSGTEVPQFSVMGYSFQPQNGISFPSNRTGKHQLLFEATNYDPLKHFQRYCVVQNRCKADDVVEIAIWGESLVRVLSIPQDTSQTKFTRSRNAVIQNVTENGRLCWTTKRGYRGHFEVISDLDSAPGASFVNSPSLCLFSRTELWEMTLRLHSSGYPNFEGYVSALTSTSFDTATTIFPVVDRAKVIDELWAEENMTGFAWSYPVWCTPREKVNAGQTDISIEFETVSARMDDATHQYVRSVSCSTPFTVYNYSTAKGRKISDDSSSSLNCGVSGGS